MNERIIVTNFIEGSVDLLYIPVPFADFLKEDGSYHTINSYCEVTNRELIYNHDKTRFIFGYELSDLYNITRDLKAILTTQYGKELGGKDFTVTGENKIWILTYSERNKFIAQNPNWKELEYE